MKRAHDYLAHILRTHLQAFEKQFPRIQKGDDAESLHRLRVASRRLRTALWVGKDYLPKKERKAWRKSIRLFGRGTGAARDVDIQTALIREMRRGIRPAKVRQGMERLDSLLVKRRRREWRNVRRALKRIERDRTGVRLRKWLQRGDGPGRDLNTPDLRALAHQKVGKCLARLVYYERYLRDAPDVARLHRMRIAAKQLRYVLEMFAPLYDRQLRKYSGSARRVQRLLGRVHDLDLLMDYLAQLVETGSLSASQTREVRVLFDRCVAERGRTYHRFLLTWKTSRGASEWEKLYEYLAVLSSRK